MLKLTVVRKSCSLSAGCMLRLIPLSWNAWPARERWPGGHSESVIWWFAFITALWLSLKIKIRLASMTRFCLMLHFWSFPLFFWLGSISTIDQYQLLTIVNQYQPTSTDVTFCRKIVGSKISMMPYDAPGTSRAWPKAESMLKIMRSDWVRASRWHSPLFYVRLGVFFQDCLLGSSLR